MKETIIVIAAAAAVAVILSVVLGRMGLEKELVTIVAASVGAITGTSVHRKLSKSK